MINTIDTINIMIFVSTVIYGISGGLKNTCIFIFALMTNRSVKFSNVGYILYCTWVVSLTYLILLRVLGKDGLVEKFEWLLK
ncbi:hypothetical protein [Alishewanella phage vB_AspM_Slickus01]|nr:hypothetical protein [Alishewanella phage vB_AspM_Slickus01]